MRDFINSCGIAGLAIIAVSLVILVIGAVLMGLTRGRTPLLPLLPACLLPLAIGLLATVSARADVQMAVEAAGAMAEPSVLAHGLRTAWNTT